MSELRIQRMKVGDKYISPARMVTKTDIETFGTLTGMLHPLFLSDAAVKSDGAWQKVGLKGSVVQGQLSYAIALGNLFREQIIDNVIVQLGATNLRWPAPCFPYDILRTEIEIKGRRTTKDGDRVVVDYKWQLKNQRDEVVAEADNTCMFRNV